MHNTMLASDLFWMDAPLSGVDSCRGGIHITGSTCRGNTGHGTQYHFQLWKHALCGHMQVVPMVTAAQLPLSPSSTLRLPFQTATRNRRPQLPLTLPSTHNLHSQPPLTTATHPACNIHERQGSKALVFMPWLDGLWYHILQHRQLGTCVELL